MVELKGGKEISGYHALKREGGILPQLAESKKKGKETMDSSLAGVVQPSGRTGPSEPSKKITEGLDGLLGRGSEWKQEVRTGTDATIVHLLESSQEGRSNVFYGGGHVSAGGGARGRAYKGD